MKGKEVKFEGVGGSGARRSPTFLVLQPVVLQVVLDAALELLQVVAGDQDGHEGVQGIESFLGGRRTQTGVATWQVGRGVSVGETRAGLVPVLCSCPRVSRPAQGSPWATAPAGVEEADRARGPLVCTCT